MAGAGFIARDEINVQCSINLAFLQWKLPVPTIHSLIGFSFVQHTCGGYTCLSRSQQKKKILRQSTCSSDIILPS